MNVILASTPSAASCDARGNDEAECLDYAAPCLIENPREGRRVFAAAVGQSPCECDLAARAYGEQERVVQERFPLARPCLVLGGVH